MKLRKYLLMTVAIMFMTGLILMAEEAVKTDKPNPSGSSTKDDLDELTNPSRPGGEVKPDKTLDDDLDELQEELKPEPIPEETDILELLNQIEDKMNEAADGLSRSAAWEGIKKQEQVGLPIEEVLKRQKEAVEKLNSVFGNTKGKQQNAIDNITKLLKLARQMQSQQQSEGQQQGQKPQPSPQLQPGQDKPGTQPATAPYNATTSLPPGGERRTGTASDRWGILPAKLREAIMLSTSGEFLTEYQEKLTRYFKILAGEKE